jgi:hypothetical protein
MGSKRRRIEWSLSDPVTPRQFNTGDFDNSIRFLPGAAEYLSTSAPLLRPVIQRRLASKIAQLNGTVAQDAHLEEFLFGGNRISLSPVTAHLVDLHNGRCFYCDVALDKQAQIDHWTNRHAAFTSTENFKPTR